MPSSDPHLFTSESVTEGHPDKVADQISDAILDLVLEHDPAARVACETLVAPGKIILAGEIGTKVDIEIEAADYERVARETVREIGYDRPEEGFDADESEVLCFIHRQSADISAMVDDGGAGDQGLMFGYACTETGELMPLPVMLAHRLTRRLAEVRHEGVLPFLRPDGKSQVTVEYRDGRPWRVRTVVIATQHEKDVSLAEVRAGVEDAVVRPALPGELVDEATEIRVNKRGRFVIGGPQGDAGLTGRKIIVDTYGGSAPHGGGAFSGKDPSKVDRSASYMARYIAKNMVAADLAERVEVQLAYVIGDREPVSVHVNTFGSGELPNRELERLVREEFPLSPAEIVRVLDLQRPIYRATAAYGHFGREDAEFSWERLDRAEQLCDQLATEAGSPAA